MGSYQGNISTMQLGYIAFFSLATVFTLGDCTETATKAASPLINCGCQCSPLTWRDAAGHVQGNCRTVDGTGAQWCYVDPNYSSCHPRGSPPTPGPTRPAPPQLKALPSAQVMLPLQLRPMCILRTSTPTQSTCTPLSTTQSTQSTPPTLFPTITQLVPLLRSEVRAHLSRKYSETTEPVDTILRASESPDMEMLQARLIFLD